ncbi:MAG: hypothetical protein ABFD60_07935 [Bryobacteraceae bacterium]
MTCSVGAHCWSWSSTEMTAPGGQLPHDGDRCDCGMYAYGEARTLGAEMDALIAERDKLRVQMETYKEHCHKAEELSGVRADALRAIACLFGLGDSGLDAGQVVSHVRVGKQELDALRARVAQLEADGAQKKAVIEKALQLLWGAWP